MDKIQTIKALLKLKQHPQEGGFFSETYRSAEKIDSKCLPKRYKSTRSVSTAIYYLFTAESISLLHRLKTDEIFHFYFGDPVEMFHILPNGKAEITILGSNIFKGMRPQVLVKKGVWQGASLKKGGSYALVGTTVAPGFEHEDYEHADRRRLLKKYPQYKKHILNLTGSSIS
ncbi:MAG: hypothetical protein A2252_12160 [Elusimicrobia bacterium RIFOXYA2_FULL_39_19]|nr:MAG: hypothetical protein A2252_12160 [Elusimicrobia bacterium RIFOXYA2_FULL_39_19]